MKGTHCNMDFIRSFTDLEHLKFEKCYLQNLDFLENINQLKTVELLDCRLNNINGLANCYQLERLNLQYSDREIEDASVLFDLIENGKLRYIKAQAFYPIEEQFYQLENTIAVIDES